MRPVRTHNMEFAKIWADGSCISTFVFQFSFISSLTLLIQLQLAGANGILFPPLRQASNVSYNSIDTKNQE